MKAYKGFNSDLTCRGFQYKEGETFTHDGDVALCESGFHACTNPIDTLHYYSPAEGSRYFEVECEGVAAGRADDSKSGDRSTAATSGYRSTAIAYGKDSIAVANGYQAKAKGVLGSYIAITEYDDNDNLLWVECHKVDGKTIKADTLYMLKNGRFVEVKG